MKAAARAAFDAKAPLVASAEAAWLATSPKKAKRDAKVAALAALAELPVPCEPPKVEPKAVEPPEPEVADVEMRRVFEYDPISKRWVDVLRAFPRKRSKRGEVSEAEKAARELKAKNREVREALGNHRYRGQVTQKKPIAKYDQRCRNDAHGSGQSMMRDSRYF